MRYPTLRHLKASHLTSQKLYTLFKGGTANTKLTDFER